MVNDDFAFSMCVCFNSFSANETAFFNRMLQSFL